MTTYKQTATEWALYEQRRAQGHMMGGDIHQCGRWILPSNVTGSDDVSGLVLRQCELGRCTDCDHGYQFGQNNRHETVQSWSEVSTRFFLRLKSLFQKDLHFEIWGFIFSMLNLNPFEAQTTSSQSNRQENRLGIAVQKSLKIFF